MKNVVFTLKITLLFLLLLTFSALKDRNKQEKLNASNQLMKSELIQNTLSE